MRNIVEFDVTDQAFQHNPYAVYERLHANNEVLWDSRLQAYFFGHYQDVSHILLSPEFITTPLAKRAEPVMGDRVLAQMEGDEHHAKRRAVLSGLTGRLFRERYAAMIEHVTLQLIQPHLPLGEIDLISDFGKEYSVLVSLKVLGLPTDRYRDVAVWHGGIAAFITSLSMTEEQKRFSLECSRQIIEYLTPIVQQRERQADGSLLSILCDTESGGQSMTTSEIVALILNVLLAATEPADKTLAYLFHHLLSNAGEMERVKADRALLAAAIAETLRLTSPVQLIPRQTKQHLNLAGVDLPADALVFCLIGAANRDPSVFTAPNKFLLDRKQAARNQPDLGKVANHLAFGAGMHICVGAAFSLMQIELTANLLLDHLQQLSLAPGHRLRESGLYTRGPAALHLRFRPVTKTGDSRVQDTDSLSYGVSA